MPLFPPTRWTVVLTAARTDTTSAHDNMARLCQTYWYPLYAYVRHRGYQPHDAEDAARIRKTLLRLLAGGVDPHQMRYLAEAFSWYAQPEDVPVLLALARKERQYSGCWQPAIRGLVRLDPAACRTVYEERFDDFFFRAAAARELPALGGNCEDIVLPLLQNRNPKVQLEACGILGKIGTQKSIDAITAHLGKIPDASDRFFYDKKAEQAIGEIRKRN